MTRAVCSGELDLDYLGQATSRAGLPAPTASLEIEPLHGGRTGAKVVRVVSGEQRFVLKTVPAENWRNVGAGRPDGGEGPLWLSDLITDVDPIRWPAIDVSLSESDRHWWLLMRDVGAGIRDRGLFTVDDTRTLFAGLARLHAHHYESEPLSRSPLPEVLGTTRVLTEPLLHLSGYRKSDEPWVTALLQDFQVIGAFAPLFLDVLGPALADDFLAMVADSSWRSRIARHPATLLHGDLRRANIAFEAGDVVLLDWEFAAIGPPACDLQWHCFLHYWAYPPKDVEAGDHCDGLRDEYAAGLEAALGRPIDREAFAESWDLGWIRVMAQLGYCLIDPLYPDGGTPEQRAHAKTLSAAAVRRALQSM